MTKSNVGQDAYCSQAHGVVHLLREASQKPEVVFESRNTKKQRKREGGKERSKIHVCSANFPTLEYSRAQILGTVLPTFRLGLPLQLRKPRQCPTDKAMGQSELDHPLSGPLSQGILYCINLTF